jgi:hypothetical protein
VHERGTISIRGKGLEHDGTVLGQQNDDVERKRTREGKRKTTKHLVQRLDNESNVGTE